MKILIVVLIATRIEAVEDSKEDLKDLIMMVLIVTEEMKAA
jgi:hypothetical protein